jgi:hypothetical protein
LSPSFLRGTIIFSQSLNWELTADVTAGPWKGRKMKLGSNKEVAILQGHRRKRDLSEKLVGNFQKNIATVGSGIN